MKEQIIYTATELFLSQGFKSVTMDDIAAELAMSKKTLYQQYSNKETIVAVVVDKLFENICGIIDAICVLKKNPIEEVYEIKKQVMFHLKDEAAAPMHQLQKYYPKIHSSLKARQFHYMQECVVDNIKRGLDQGLFRPNIDVEFVSRIYFVGVIGIKDQQLFPASMY
ncbi:MAG: TetR/AcrR family transcriptional regulator, partial [Bacteroidota bacterium]